MKTKILKFGMPLMAFLLAIVFAFATEKNIPIEDNTLITGYILNSDGCTPVSTNCVVGGATVCKYLNKPLHVDRNCQDFMYGWIQ